MQRKRKHRTTALLGLLASQVAFVFFGIFITLHAMKYNYLQINDWSAYIGFLYCAYGLPFAVIGSVVGIIGATFLNRVR